MGLMDGTRADWERILDEALDARIFGDGPPHGIPTYYRKLYNKMRVESPNMTSKEIKHACRTLWKYQHVSK